MKYIGGLQIDSLRSEIQVILGNLKSDWWFGVQTYCVLCQRRNFTLINYLYQVNSINTMGCRTRTFHFKHFLITKTQTNDPNAMEMQTKMIWFVKKSHSQCQTSGKLRMDCLSLSISVWKRNHELDENSPTADRNDCND